MQNEHHEHHEHHESQHKSQQLSNNELNYLSLNPIRYCIKTGKQLTLIPYIEIEELILTHGFDRAKIVINKLQQSIALEWILTDSTALQKLSISSPREYLIYAISSLINKPNPENTIEMIDSFNNKILANKNLQQISFDQIVNTSELVRRILASNRPAAIHEMLSNLKLNDICTSIESLYKFQVTLQECIKQIGLGYYDDTIINQRQRQKKELFNQQRRLIALSTLEKEINESLPSFDEIEMPIGELKQIILGNVTKKLIKSNKIAKSKQSISLNQFKNQNKTKTRFNIIFKSDKKDVK